MDSSYQGVNLLTGGELKVTFNEARTHHLSVKGKDMRSDKIGINDKKWKNKDDIKVSIKEILDATSLIRNYVAELGNKLTIIQTRQSFTEALSDILEIGADKLTLADMNEVSAEYLMLQTRQQLAVNSLSLASQSAKSILSLF
jgi:flagellin-like hook-associated protein FlgL